MRLVAANCAVLRVVVRERVRERLDCDRRLPFCDAAEDPRRVPSLAALLAVCEDLYQRLDDRLVVGLLQLGDDSIADRVALLSRYVREQLDDRVHRGVAHYRALVAERARQRLDRLGVVRLPERAGGDAPE